MAGSVTFPDMDASNSPAERWDAHLQGVVDCVDAAHLRARVERGEHLRIKFGIDPSAPDIHLGHTVPMRLLRRWQDLGHTPVLIIGDVTAQIGDPTGRSATRPQLTAEEVAANARTYLEQLFTVVAKSGAEVRWQSEWFGKFGLSDVLRLAGTATVAQLLQRSDFGQRMAEERPIGLHELLYPLLQGYDSVAVAADVELGGTDQLFNLLRGREVQLAYGMAPQDVVTVPLLVGIDGQRKMSKSLGNAVGVADAPDDQFGRLMSLPDAQILPYLELATSTPVAESRELASRLGAGQLLPRDLKELMARRVVAEFHGEDAADRAAQEFLRRFRFKELPSEIAEVVIPPGPLDPRDLLVRAGMASSRSAGLRLLGQGAVRLGDHRLPAAPEPVEFPSGTILRVGPRRVVRLVLSEAARP
ncbi:MAG: tyrosine--tRNA ligase [Candidatus Dormibacteria bacterium]